VVILAATGLAAGLLFHSRIVFLAALIVGGIPLVLQTLRGMLRGEFAADIVASLAIVTALILGQYFAGVIIVLMQSGGEALEAYAMDRASSSLEALMARAPKVAHRVRGGDVDDVPVEGVVVGDELLVRPGDLVPVDCEVAEGTSTVDQSAASTASASATTSLFISPPCRSRGRWPTLGEGSIKVASTILQAA